MESEERKSLDYDVGEDSDEFGEVREDADAVNEVCHEREKVETH